jgi:hypothetical protein
VIFVFALGIEQPLCQTRGNMLNTPYFRQIIKLENFGLLPRAQVTGIFYPDRQDRLEHFDPVWAVSIPSPDAPWTATKSFCRKIHPPLTYHIVVYRLVLSCYPRLDITAQHSLSTPSCLGPAQPSARRYAMKAKYLIIPILVIALIGMVAAPPAEAELVTLSVILVAAYASAIIANEAINNESETDSTMNSGDASTKQHASADSQEVPSIQP